MVGGQAAQLLAQIRGVSCKSQLLDLLEKHAGEFNFSYNGVAVALEPMLDAVDLPRLLHIPDIWQAKGDKDSCAAISRLLSLYEPARLLAAFTVPIEEMPPQTASLLAEAMSRRGDDESFHVLAQLLLAHPSETTSDSALAMTAYAKDGPATKHCCLDHRHVEAIWSARFSQELWESALSAVCAVRPDLAVHVTQMAEAHTGIEAIALRYCAGADKKALLSILEQLLERDDDSLQGEPFAFFGLRNLDWWGRELLLARSLSRALPALRKVLLEGSFGALPMRQGVLD